MTELVSAAERGSDPVLARHIEAVFEDDAAHQTAAAIYFRQLLSPEQEQVQEYLCERQVIARLVDVLRQSDLLSLQREIAHTLGDLITTSSFLAEAAVSGGAIPVFIQALHSTDDDLCQHALFAITNLAGCNVQHRDAVLASNVFDGFNSVLRRLQKSHDLYYVSTLAKELSWAVSNVCHGKPYPPLESVLPALPILNVLFESKREETLTNVFYAFAAITNKGDTERIDAVRRLGVLPRIIQRLYATESPKLQMTALKVVGNFSAGSEFHVKLLLHQRVEEELTPMLHHPDAVVRSDVCWIFSNLLTGPSEMVQHLLDVVPSLIQLASSDAPKVRKEAIWAIANAISAAAPDRIRGLIDQNVLSVFCALLRMEDDEATDQQVSLALDGVEILLTKAQAFDVALFAEVKAILSDPENGIVFDLTDIIQHDDNVEIQRRAARVWLTFFQ